MRRIPSLRRLALAAALAVVTAVSLASCADGAAGTDPDTVVIQGDAGNPTLIENFNPFINAQQMLGTRLIYEPMVVVSAVDGSYRGFLATRWTFPSADELDLTMRDGVKWSDGQPFSAQDVVFTYNLIKKVPALDIYGVWSQLKSVTASGDVVKLQFKSANVPFANIAVKPPIVPQHLWKDVKDPAKYTNVHPVGTGPYRLNTFAPTQYRLARNDNYWGKQPAAKYAVFPAQASNSNVGQLSVVNGDFDWSYTFLPKVDKTYLSRDRSNRAYWFPPGGAISLFLNLTKKPYSDVNFRQGVSLALDRPTIALKAVNGYLTQASTSGLVLPNLQRFLDPSLPDKGFVTQNREQSLARFKAAGYTLQGSKLVDSSGKQVAMTVLVPAGFNDWIQASQELKQQLGRIGIAVTVDTPQYTQYSQQAFTGKFDAAFGGFGGSGSVYNDLNNVLNSSFAAKVGTSSINNFERYKNSDTDKALANLASAVGEQAQIKASYPVQQIMYKQVPLIPLYYGGSWGLFNNRNFTGWPSAKDPYNLPTNYTDSLLDVLTRIRKS